MNSGLTVSTRKIARRILPAKFRKLIHRILGDEAAITVRYEVLSNWPEADQPNSWREAKMGKDLIKEIAAFDLKRAKLSPQRTFTEPIVQDNLKLLSQIPLKEANFLDFGCGNGIYYYILSSYPSTAAWKYSGADANSEFIRFCKSNLPHLRYAELQADGDLPFKDGEFDVILASGVLQCIRDYERVLLELYRITKKYVVVSRLPLWEMESIILRQHFKHRKDHYEQHLTLNVVNLQ
jgi:SAM-dependent methyltransferase